MFVTQRGTRFQWRLKGGSRLPLQAKEMRECIPLIQDNLTTRFGTNTAVKTEKKENSNFLSWLTNAMQLVNVKNQ